jgi:hypothetical protein
MSDATADALYQFNGTLITTGETAVYDDWMNERETNALEGVPHKHLSIVNEALIPIANTDLLRTDAPSKLQIGLRRALGRYVVVLVNTAAGPTTAFNLDLRLSGNEHVDTARLMMLDGHQVDVPFTLATADGFVRLDVPPGVDTTAILEIATTGGSERFYLPLVSR